MIAWLHAYWWIGWSAALVLLIWLLVEFINSDLFAVKKAQKFARIALEEVEQADRDIMTLLEAIRNGKKLTESEQKAIRDIKEAEQAMKDIMRIW